MTKNDKLIIHSVLLDYNMQLLQFDRSQVTSEEDMTQVRNGVLGARFAISNFVEFMMDEEGGLNSGTEMLLGHLLQQNLGFLKEMAEDALKQGEKLPEEFYNKREDFERLAQAFPVEEEEKTRIIMP